MESPPSNNDSSSSRTALSSSPPPDQVKSQQNQEMTVVPVSCSQPEPLKRTSPGSARSSKPVMEVISEQFPAFDADALIVRPFGEEAARDAKFEQELSDMLLNVILKTHAWAASRPKHEAAFESQKLEEEIAQIMDTEREQEQTRQRLGEFVHRMKTALAALMGVP